MSREQDQHTGTANRQEAYWLALFLQEESREAAARASKPWLDKSPPAPFEDNSTVESPTWRLAAEYMTTDRILELRVTGFNKGGLLVDWRDLQGFVPASQLVDFPQLHIPHERLYALAALQDKLLRLKIIEVNPQSNRLVLSERTAQVRAAQRVDLLQRLRSGTVVKGRVTNLTDFGAFVDLGGVEGLVHISELSWSRVVHPSQVLEPGQDVHVLVLNVDRERERIALSRKRLKPDPWDLVEERYHVDDIVQGIVSNVANFGAFVLLEEELEGLIHISELAEGAILHPRNVVQRGDRVEVRVLNVDGPRKRLSLSLRSGQITS